MARDTALSAIIFMLLPLSRLFRCHAAALLPRQAPARFDYAITRRYDALLSIF